MEFHYLKNGKRIVKSEWLSFQSEFKAILMKEKLPTEKKENLMIWKFWNKIKTWKVDDVYNIMCLGVIAFCLILMSNLLLYEILTRHGM